MAAAWASRCNSDCSPSLGTSISFGATLKSKTKTKHSKPDFFIFIFLLLRAASEAYGGSQAKGPIGAAAAGPGHNHAGSELCLQPTSWLTATPDIEPATSWFLARFVSAEPPQELPVSLSYIFSKGIWVLKPTLGSGAVTSYNMV